MKSNKVAAKPAAKPIVRVAARKAAATKRTAITPAKAVAPVVVKAPVKSAANAKSAAPTAAKAAAKVVAKTVSPIVRDSFTMTAADQELLKKCKRDAVASGRDSTKKSEIVRAALRHFASLSASTRLMEINGLDAVKTGRPKNR